MVSGIILAAGASARMGRPKQLLPYRGRPLLQHVIDAAGASALDEVIVVLGHAAEEIRSAILLPPRARIVLNPEYASGQASSLRAALGAAADESRAALVLLGDQPGVGPDIIRTLLRVHGEGAGRIVQSEYAGVPGHPVILDRRIWGELLALEGDTGARPVLARHPEWIVPVPLGGPPPEEVDTPEDYRRLLERKG